jgi:membrane-associated phospholipid phosphatase
VKVKASRFPLALVATVAQGRAVLRGTGAVFAANKLLALAILLGTIAVGLFIWPHDRQLLETVHWWCRGERVFARSAAGFLGTWGDYPTYNVPMTIAIWLYGAVTKSSEWRRAAIVYFLGATLAGVFDDCFRLTLGRPRPEALLPDGFYGLTHGFDQKFESFPSGHAAADFGAAFALLMVKRPLGFLALLFAFAVAWARMELNRHYPSDVAVGSAIGIYFGCLVGFGAVHRAQLEPLKTAPGLARHKEDLRREY